MKKREEEEEEKDGSGRLRRSGRLWWEDVLVRGREKPYGRQECQVMRSTFLLNSNKYTFLLFPLLSSFSYFLEIPVLIRAEKTVTRKHFHIQIVDKIYALQLL